MSITNSDISRKLSDQKLSLSESFDRNDSPGKKGTMSIGDDQYSVSQSPTHLTDQSLLASDDDPFRRLPSSSDDSSSAAEQLTGKIRFSSLNFDTRKVGKGWRVFTAPFVFLRSIAVGAVAGAGAGAGAGAATGAGAGATAILGGAAGTLGGIGWGLGAAGREAWTGEMADTLVAGGGWKSQSAHGQRAITSLNRAGFFADNRLRDEAEQNFAQVSDREWRKLLHVPTHYRTTSWFQKLKGKFTSTEPRIKDARDRQKIREAVMLYVARHGKTGAAAYRARLLEKGSQNPASLQTEINKLKAGVLAGQVAATTDYTELNEIIQRNPEVFAHPQNYSELGDLRGYQSILGVVDRLDAQGGVTQADREDLINAFKTAGVDNPPDILNGHVGKPMTSALRHKIVEAFRDHIIQGQKLLNVNPFDHSGVNDVAARRYIVGEIASKGYKDATSEQERETRSKQEMLFIKNKVNQLSWRAYATDDEDFSTKARMESHLRSLDRGFETPAQEERRLQQQG